MDRHSRAILAKGIKLDKQYKNIVDYTETQMVNLCLANKVYEANNCSIIKNNESVELDVNFTVALQANYIAFENPNYGNKWFFAFIDRVEYISDNATRIYFSVDELSTWRDYWDIKPTFVVREHVNDDTIGLHTVGEGLDLGDYSIVDLQHSVLSNNWYIVFAVTKFPDVLQRMGDNGRVKGDIGYIGGVFSSLKYFAVNTFANAQRILDLFTSDASVGIDAIKNMYMIPKECVNILTSLPTQYVYDGGVVELLPLFNYFESDSFYFQEPSILAGGYEPKNNKLFTYPFSYFYVTNNCGMTVDFRYEDFPTETHDGVTAKTITYTKYIVPSTSVSAKLVFDKYKNYTSTVDYTTKLNAYGVTFGKVPVCAWDNDIYTNWLTQNGTNVALDLLKAGTGIAIGAVAGMASGGLGALAIGASVTAGVNTIMGAVQKDVEMSKIPPQAQGDVNTGDYNFCFNRNIISFYKMSIRSEYASIIDNFFNLKGYKINSVKVPNETGRTYWNYVQIASESVIGTTKNTISVPTSSMDVINNAYRAGVTIWHDHANIGNYSLNNTIVTPTP